MSHDAWMARTNLYEERDEDNVRCPAGAWRQRAACREMHPAFMFEPIYRQRALELCETCPVSGECLAYAIKYGEGFGVWGGCSTRERNRIARELAGGPRKRRPRAKKNTTRKRRET